MNEQSEQPEPNIEQKPKFRLNEAGEIVSDKPQSKVRQFIGHLRMVYGYARQGIEQGWYKKPKPGEARSNLEMLKASLEKSKPVEVTPEGKIQEKV